MEKKDQPESMTDGRSYVFPLNPRLAARLCARSVPLLRVMEEISTARKVGHTIDHET
jgi:hypothetical protein